MFLIDFKRQLAQNPFYLNTCCQCDWIETEIYIHVKYEEKT